MWDINDSGAMISIQYLADLLNCSKRTIYRNIDNQLKQEIKLLNEKI
jgi:transcriptional antiterminator